MTTSVVPIHVQQAVDSLIDKVKCNHFDLDQKSCHGAALITKKRYCEKCGLWI